MTAKEKQTEFIRTYLKPTLKSPGYQTSGQTWWKDKGEFFNVVNLQNYSWNSKDSFDFRFNIGIALKATVKDETRTKASYSDLITHLDEGTFLPDRKNRKFGNNQGYSIRQETDVEEFTKSFKIDFETYVLPGLERQKSLGDCLFFYERFPLWHDKLKRVIEANKLTIQ